MTTHHIQQKVGNVMSWSNWHWPVLCS